jgi:hypothetical protein
MDKLPNFGIESGYLLFSSNKVLVNKCYITSAATNKNITRKNYLPN